ncbi:MAG: GAF domain-containing protein, partial [Sulfuricaulis sp.]|nr:GAF domain-containing protein [Sulfuricaulis sp.]
MSALLGNKPAAQDNLAERLNFSMHLQSVANKIHGFRNLDEIVVKLSQEICDLFNAERLTIYLVSEDKTSIISKVKTGPNSINDLKLPISEQNIAGFVAANKRMFNIRDVYDEKELKSYSPMLNFMKQIDAKTGYRTKQMLVSPVVDAQTKELLGVVQFINS